MSHIGSSPIIIPNNISLHLLSFSSSSSSYQSLIISGPLGSHSLLLPLSCSVSFSSSSLSLSFPSHPHLWGSLHRKISQSFLGLSLGHHRFLNLNGVGYKASVSNNSFLLSVGFSHPLVFPIPSYISFSPDSSKPQKFSFSSSSLDLLTQWLHSIVSFKPSSHDPYKHKGLFVSSS